VEWMSPERRANVHVPVTTPDPGADYPDHLKLRFC